MKPLDRSAKEAIPVLSSHTVWDQQYIFQFKTDKTETMLKPYIFENFKSYIFLYEHGKKQSSGSRRKRNFIRWSKVLVCCCCVVSFMLLIKISHEVQAASLPVFLSSREMRVLSLETRVSSLDTRVLSLETRVSSLKTRISWEGGNLLLSGTLCDRCPDTAWVSTTEFIMSSDKCLKMVNFWAP